VSFTLDEAIYRSVLEVLPTGVCITDLDCKILFWNKKAEEITGHLSQEVLGVRTSEEVLGQCDENCKPLNGDQCAQRATGLDGTARNADVFIQHKQGLRLPVRSHVMAVRDTDGHIVAVVDCFRERVPLSEAELHAIRSSAHDHTDLFTGVLDQPSILSHLKLAMQDFTNTHIPFGVVSAAVDRFEDFRDLIGARGMDMVLWATARTLARSLPHGDMVGRWGRNRFVAIIADGRKADLEAEAHKLQHLASLDGIPWWGEKVKATISIGATAVQAGDTASALVSRAEEALGASIAGGGNRVTVS
jgi:two-component system, cell cycle response regulator